MRDEAPAASITTPKLSGVRSTQSPFSCIVIGPEVSMDL
jgi:hypothetical protein